MAAPRPDRSRALVPYGYFERPLLHPVQLAPARRRRWLPLLLAAAVAAAAAAAWATDAESYLSAAIQGLWR